MSNDIKIYVPLETTAVSLGANDVAAKLDALDNTHVVRNGSWGACWLEPMIEVVVDDQRIAYGPVSPDDIESLVAANFLEGGDHALRLGPTNKIPYLINQERWTFFRAGLIEALSLDDYSLHGGFKGLTKALDGGPESTLVEISTSGLRGRGGAAFPTGIKWQTVADAPGDQKYIACNADEGDSGTYSDRMLMESDPFTLIEGMLIAGYAVGASRG